MLFNTWTYGLFLPLVFALYLLLPLRGRQIMLLAASYVFYCWEKPVYGLLLLASTVLDYFAGLLIEGAATQGRRRLWLACSLAGNLGMLGFFKYADFVGSNVCGIGALLGINTHWDMLNYVLPVGISFYTFQTMSYTIQVYRRQAPAERNPFTFALYVSFFPQLVAGPIERATNLLPQLNTYHRITSEDLAAGATRILVGLFRKVVIADRAAIVVNAVFTNPDAYPASMLWLGVVFFSVQIYFDFAGYADIAIGSARLFGIHLCENFNYPLLSRSIADFWNRWHMTLTGWFRDYVFYPLGGFRKGGARAALNGAIVLLLCGLWHGAQWHFVLWGVFNAVLLTGYYAWKFWQKRQGIHNKAAHALRPAVLASIAFTFVLNCLGLVFFRSPNLQVIGKMFSGMFGFRAVPVESAGWCLWVWWAFFAFLAVLEFSQGHLNLNDRIRKWPWPAKAIGLALLAALTLLGAVNLDAPYIYFQF
ncbi:MAG: MBOAT family O-acyltransferase [Lentisphaerota bacterium]